MLEPSCHDLIVLNAAWRPVARVPVRAAWRTVVHAALHHDGRWMLLDQRRRAGASVTPHEHDFALTRALHRRLRPLDIGLADHLIRAGGRRFSFRAAGLL